MDQWRTKSPIAVEEEIQKRAKDIYDEFKQFATGVRCLFLISRHKEGGEVNNTKLKKVITRSPKEFQEALEPLIREMLLSESPLRIYSSVNERDFNKAIRQFKYEQLDADYYDQIQKENFYLDVKNRFIGCLMQPPQRATSLFLWDVDNVPEIKDTTAEILSLIPEGLIIKFYPTKNGWHLVTKPFNYTTLVLPKNVEMKKDGLLLLAF